MLFSLPVSTVTVSVVLADACRAMPYNHSFPALSGWRPRPHLCPGPAPSLCSSEAHTDRHCAVRADRDTLKLTQEEYEGVPLAVRLEVLVAAVLCMWGAPAHRARGVSCAVHDASRLRAGPQQHSTELIQPGSSARAFCLGSTGPPGPDAHPIKSLT